MDKDIYGQYTISNLYYDTPVYDLIRRSIEKPIYKEKFRVRSYGVPGPEDTIFAEIKKKYKGIVYKRRIADTYEEIQSFIKEQKVLPTDRQIQKEIQWFLKMYEPKAKVYIGYDRIAYAGKDGEDIRVTFDEKIRYREKDLDLRAGDYGEPIVPDDWIIMEVKVPKAIPLWLVKVLSENQIYSNSFSKYGTCYQQFLSKKLFSGGKTAV
ncbi:MAG: polyphosphate polymerase domain-containing protein [Eubacterium sp.]|nr:polyphosphate polymerase domain-containing protein [Eubacterium sp.]